MTKEQVKQIENIRNEISLLAVSRKETELELEKKSQEVLVLEAKLSAVNSRIEAYSLISTFADGIADLEKENANLKTEVESLKSQFNQPTQNPSNRPILENNEIIQDDVGQVSPTSPIDESLLTMDKKKSQSTDSSQN